jgi:cytochrome c oxidase cbb3-type subunit 2
MHLLQYKHWEKIEKNVGLLAVLIAVAVSFGGLAEITPLFVKAQTIQPSPGVKPYDGLRLAGRDIYVREGCYLCHSQMIRSLRFETQRYGEHSVLGDSVYDRPFQWGSKRTGPESLRASAANTPTQWQKLHLIAPRTLCR